jgi:uncharacterized protein involved in exopolysaccharide biosynthesis
MIGEFKLGGTQLAKLSELYSKQVELARLETEHDLARSVYREVATRYEEARLQVAARSAQLQVLDFAVPSGQPVGPRVVRNAAVGLVAGFTLSSIAALLFGAVVSAAARRQAGQATPPGRDARS